MAPAHLTHQGARTAPHAVESLKSTAIKKFHQCECGHTAHTEHQNSICDTAKPQQKPVSAIWPYSVCAQNMGALDTQVHFCSGTALFPFNLSNLILSNTSLPNTKCILEPVYTGLICLIATKRSQLHMAGRKSGTDSLYHQHQPHLFANQLEDKIAPRCASCSAIKPPQVTVTFTIIPEGQCVGTCRVQGVRQIVLLLCNGSVDARQWLLLCYQRRCLSVTVLPQHAAIRYNVGHGLMCLAEST